MYAVVSYLLALAVQFPVNSYKLTLVIACSNVVNCLNKIDDTSTIKLSST